LEKYYRAKKPCDTFRNSVKDRASPKSGIKSPEDL